MYCVITINYSKNKKLAVIYLNKKFIQQTPRRLISKLMNIESAFNPGHRYLHFFHLLRPPARAALFAWGGF